MLEKIQSQNHRIIDALGALADTQERETSLRRSWPLAQQEGGGGGEGGGRGEGSVSRRKSEGRMSVSESRVPGEGGDEKQEGSEAMASTIYITEDIHACTVCTVAAYGVWVEQRVEQCGWPWCHYAVPFVAHVVPSDDAIAGLANPQCFELHVLHTCGKPDWLSTHDTSLLTTAVKK